MNILKKISENGSHISWERHRELLGVVQSASESDLGTAHKRVLNELHNKNIWVAIDENGVMLSREWPDSPGVAIVSFPDQGTADHVLGEVGAVSFNSGVVSYSDALKSANTNNALLVMVTYETNKPHYVPISHLGSSEDIDESRRPWWKIW